MINRRLSTKLCQIHALNNTAVSAGYCLCLRMMKVLKRITGFGGKDDGAHRGTRTWFSKQGEIIRERVPAYRLRQDKLEAYLKTRFPRYGDFKIQVSVPSRPIPSRITNIFGWISFLMTISILKFLLNYPGYMDPRSLR